MIIIQKITFNGKISDYIIINDWTKKKSRYVPAMLNILSIMLFKLNFPM